MEVYEIKLKIYVMKDIDNKNTLAVISDFIDKSFLKDNSLADLHTKNAYKYYSHNSFFPIEKSKTYKAGNIYTVIIRTVDLKLVAHFEKHLVNEYTDYLKALTIEKRIIPRKHIQQIYSITPAIAKFDNGYWKSNQSIEIFKKRLKENLIKKYNSYFNTKIQEDFELFTFIKFENNKPIASNYKDIQLLGDKLTIDISENSIAQDLAYFALGSGILEMNSRGFGFINYNWL